MGSGIGGQYNIKDLYRDLIKTATTGIETARRGAAITSTDVQLQRGGRVEDTPVEKNIAGRYVGLPATRTPQPAVQTIAPTSVQEPTRRAQPTEKPTNINIVTPESALRKRAAEEGTFGTATTVADQGGKYAREQRIINQPIYEEEEIGTGQGFGTAQFVDAGLPRIDIPEETYDPERERTTANIRRNYEQATNTLTSLAGSLSQDILNGLVTGNRKTQALAELKLVNENLSTLMQGYASFHQGILGVDIERLARGKLPAAELRAKLGLMPLEQERKTAEISKTKAEKIKLEAETEESKRKAAGLAPSWEEVKGLEIGKVKAQRENERFKAYQTGLATVISATYETEEARQRAIDSYNSAFPEFAKPTKTVDPLIQLKAYASGGDKDAQQYLSEIGETW